MKHRRKRAKVIVLTPFSRAVTSYESKSVAREQAKRFREGFRSLPASVRQGCRVFVEDE